MSRVQFLSGVAAMALASGAAVASLTATYNGKPAQWSGSTIGGPFAFTPGGFTPFGLGANQAGAGRFLTFCVEMTENLGGSPYNATIDDAAFGGGAGGGSPDFLGFSTAALYDRFMSGTLNSAVAGFTYATSSTTPPASVIDSGDAMQIAVWYLENEFTGTIAASGLGNSASRTLAQSLVTWATGQGWSNIGSVRILNLRDGVTGELRQSQLVIIPLPAQTTMAGFGVLSLAGVRVIRRRRA